MRRSCRDLLDLTGFSLLGMYSRSPFLFSAYVFSVSLYGMYTVGFISSLSVGPLCEGCFYSFWFYWVLDPVFYFAIQYVPYIAQ